MPSKFKTSIFLTSLLLFTVLMAQGSKQFTTQSAKTHVTITIHPNEDIVDDENENDQGENQDENDDQGRYEFDNRFLFFDWLKQLLKTRT